MLKLLTVELLEWLINQGYHYCLSRTTNIVGEDAAVCVTLLPVKVKPSLKKFSGRFNAFFKIEEEPRQMASGINETIVLVDLSELNAYAG